MSVYYNEHDPFAAAWLRELIKAGEIPDGFVDTRDIQNVAAADLDGYAQCHFFAGIGGWALALKLAGWPADRPVWTGSCPCQPFSTAGKNKAQSDERHLWPYWSRLIGESAPATIFGEQVAVAITKGWLDDAFDDLEAQNYACASAVLPACSVGAPHKRDRLWFVAHAISQRSHQRNVQSCIPSQTERTENREAVVLGGQVWPLADTFGLRLPGQGQYEPPCDTASIGPREAIESRHGGGSDFWRVEPSMGRVAHGVSARLGRLRGYGNAIVPQVAAEVLSAFMSLEAP